MRVTYGSTCLETVRGDIADAEADAIVNAANSELWMGSGVAGSIKKKGGSQIESEATAKGPIEIGDAVATGAGSLKAKWVIHAAAMGPDLTTNETMIRGATVSALRLAKELGAESIAFPSIGTGVGGFPNDRAAETMTDAATEHCRRSNIPRRITFVLFSEESKKAFDDALVRAAGKGRGT